MKHYLKALKQKNSLLFSVGIVMLLVLTLCLSGCSEKNEVQDQTNGADTIPNQSASAEEPSSILYVNHQLGFSMLVFLLAALENDEDKKLFTEIYEQYRPQMERTAMHFLKSHADIEDAVQNAFMQMIRHFEKIYEIPCEELSFWIISIVKNEALMIIRKSQKTVPLEDWDGLVRESENTSDYTELVDLFTKLPPSYRSVLEMKILHGFSDKEVAAHLGISETAVSSRASRGRSLLREIVKKEGFCI